MLSLFISPTNKLKVILGFVTPLLCIVLMSTTGNAKKTNIADKKDLMHVQIADPFIEMRTGPGRAYPVFYIEEKGQWVDVLRRRTSWFEVQTKRKKKGWVHQQQLQKTLLQNGQKVKIKKLQHSDISNRKRELGTLAGSFGGTSLMSIYGGYRFTPNISAEITASQALGNASNILLLDINLLQQPFPEWRFSPFFTVGTGNIKTSPAATLVKAKDRSDKTLNVGIGGWYYFTQNFMLRAEYRRYTILTDRNNNEDESQWKAGLSVFF